VSLMSGHVSGLSSLLNSQHVFIMDLRIYLIYFRLGQGQLNLTKYVACYYMARAPYNKLYASLQRMNMFAINTKKKGGWKTITSALLVVETCPSKNPIFDLAWMFVF
jgi:hypothetical protein